MKMKKTVALFLTICCIGSFVACSDNSNPTKQSTEPDATRPTTTEADTKEVPDETEEVPASVELNVDFRTMSVDEIADECIRAITNYPQVGGSVNDYLAAMPNPADPSWIRTDYIGFPGVACGARYFNDAPDNFAFYPKGVMPYGDDRIEPYLGSIAFFGIATEGGSFVGPTADDITTEPEVFIAGEGSVSLYDEATANALYDAIYSRMVGVYGELNDNPGRPDPQNVEHQNTRLIVKYRDDNGKKHTYLYNAIRMSSSTDSAGTVIYTLTFGIVQPRTEAYGN